MKRIFSNSLKYSIHASPCDESEPSEYHGTISKATGEKWLVEDMAQAQISVMTNVTIDMTDDQYAALCDFVYNVGGSNFKNSTLLTAIKAKQFDRVPAQFRRWIQAGGKPWPGLIKRRNDEIALFFKGTAIPKAVPIPGEDLSPLDLMTSQSK